MSANVLVLNDLLDYIAESVNQNLVSPRSLKYIFLLASFAFAILGILIQSRTRRRISLRSLIRLSGMVTGDVLFVLLGTGCDYLAERFGKKRVTFTSLLLPTNNRPGLVLGFLLDMCFFPTETSFIFRLAFLVPVFIGPTVMVLGGEPVDEIMIDPILAGVPILAYLLATWCSYDPTGAMAILLSLWQHRIWIVYISLACWWNANLIYYGAFGALWLFTKPFYILSDSIVHPLLESLGTKLAARQRKRWSYAAIYRDQRLVYEPYKYRPLEEGDLRLLKLWPRGPLDGVCCELGEMPFDMAISKDYEAISYTWGNPTKSHSITLEGHEFKVTKSAYDALCDHSSSWKHQFLWIDSICINQEDNLEKSKQVLLMKMIYQKAFRVVVYLGNDPDSHLAINLLKELRLFREYCPTGEEIYSKYYPEINSERWLALIRLLSHAWFERVWIIQEVVVASSVAVRYGGKYISWKTFVCAIRLLKASDEASMLVRRIPGEVSRMQSALNKISHIELLATSREDFEKGKPMSFQDVIYKYPTFKATDDRDKVYALLGCVSDAAGIPRDVLPDYGKSPASLYLDTANFLLSSGDPTLLFAHTGIGWHRKFTELPSWVPDWTSVDGPSTLGGPNCGYRAAGSLPFIINPGTTSEYSKSLVIRIVDTISMCRSPWPSRLPSDPMISHLPSAEYSIFNQREIYKWVIEAIDLASTNANHRYLSAERLVEAVWRTLIGDLRAWQNEPIGEEYGEHFRDWMALHAIFDEFEEKIQTLSAGQRGSARLEAALEARFGTGNGTGTGTGTGTGSSNTLSRFIKLGKWIMKASMMCAWRKFCVTENGYIGLVPPKSLPGDCVAIISGVKTPFVLRRLETLPIYKIVGECYIHGIMDGEMASLDHMYEVIVE